MIPDSNHLNEELIARWLVEIIHREISKPDDEADMELVEECEKTLLSLSISASLSDDELRERVKKIIGKKKDQNGLHDVERFRLIRRVAAIVVCVVVALFGSVMTAYAFVPSFQTFVREVLNIDSGSVVEIDGITYINNGEATIYSSLEELLEVEGLTGLNIMFPNNLPQEMMISRLETVYYENGVTIVIIFADKGVSMNIDNEMPIEIGDVIDSSKEVQINGILSYISEADGIYSSVSVHGTYTYYITADAEDKIITILESMNLED